MDIDAIKHLRYLLVFSVIALLVHTIIPCISSDSKGQRNCILEEDAKILASVVWLDEGPIVLHHMFTLKNSH